MLQYAKVIDPPRKCFSFPPPQLSFGRRKQKLGEGFEHRGWVGLNFNFILPL